MQHSNRFAGKNVLVTGGNSGIGFAAAKEFVREGARVLITGRDAQSLAQARAELGPAVSVLVNDASKIADGVALAAHLQQTFGHIDVAFINAGIATFGPYAEITEAAFDQSFNTNVKGPYFLLQKLAPLFSRGGSVVLNGSINAHIGMPGSSVYAATKAAFISFAKTLSSELLPQGVRVNVVSPGPVTTPLHTRAGTDRAGLTAKIPLGRFGEPQEIAQAVLFLASSDAAFIVGTELIIDGGMIQL